MEIINMKNVSKCYKDTIVLKNFNLSVSKGDFIAIVGASGKGKQRC